MVEKMDCSVVAALYAFQQARSPGIYKQDYIKELLKRYGDEDETFPAPEKPDWSCGDLLLFFLISVNFFQNSYIFTQMTTVKRRLKNIIMTPNLFR